MLWRGEGGGEEKGAVAKIGLPCQEATSQMRVSLADGSDGGSSCGGEAGSSESVSPAAKEATIVSAASKHESARFFVSPHWVLGQCGKINSERCLKPLAQARGFRVNFIRRSTCRIGWPMPSARN